VLPVVEQLSLGNVVKRAREEQDLGVRELARRSSVSAGQISRIEAGEVDRPAPATLAGLARALGRSPIPLLYLAGHIDEDEVRRHFEQLEGAVESRVGYVEAMDGAEEFSEDWQAKVIWELTANLKNLVGDLTPDDPQSAQDLQEIAAAWSSLTDERRLLVRAFIADQAVLSQLDRMPAPPGRYAIAIELTDRGSNE